MPFHTFPYVFLPLSFPDTPFVQLFVVSMLKHYIRNFFSCLYQTYQFNRYQKSRWYCVVL